MKNFLTLLTGIGFIGAFIIVIVAAVWLLYPYNPLVFKDPLFPIITKTVKQGGLLEYTSNYCKYTDMNATVSRAFINGLIYTVPLTNTNREPGCHVATIGVMIPRELPPGVYHLENTYRYQINPIREIVIKENTENFTVTE